MSEQRTDAQGDERRLVEWARAKGVDVRLHDGLPLVKTVAQAAQALDVEPSQIAKSVVFISGDEPVVVLAPGDAKVADRLVLDHVGGVRNGLRLAKPGEVLEATGFPIGGVPPFGYPRPLRTLMEARLLDHEKVVFGGGSDRALLEVDPEAVHRATQAEIGRFTR